MCARRHNPSIPPYSSVSTHGDFVRLYTGGTETLLASQSLFKSEQPGIRLERKGKKQGKVEGGSGNKSPENTTATCSYWTGSQIPGGELPASPRSRWSGPMENQERTLWNTARGATADNTLFSLENAAWELKEETAFFLLYEPLRLKIIITVIQKKINLF